MPSGKYYREDGCPIKCMGCEGTNLKDVTKDTLDGYLIMEYAVMCEDCGAQVGYWAHGYYNPYYDPDFRPEK